MQSRVWVGVGSSRVVGRWSLAKAGPLAVVLLSLLFLLALPLTAHAQATLVTGLGGTAGFGTNVLAAGDDNSSAAISLTPYDSLGLCFFGTARSNMFVNNNGNITFGALTGSYTPIAFPASTNPMMAIWWSDLDTRAAVASPAGSNRVYYDIRQVGGLGQIVITWYRVGYYSNHADKLDTFQIVIRETAIATGSTPATSANYTVEYRFGQLQWTTGDPGGTAGLGGIPAQVGFDAGNTINYWQLPGSRTAAVLDLATTSNLVPAQPGVWRYSFEGCALACTTSAECAGTTPICETTTRKCRSCSTDADCSAPTAFCATSGTNIGRCVQCNAGTSCTTGTCTNNSCVCTSNASCPAGTPICDAASPRVCRACNPSTPTDCSGTTPVCGATGNCVQCATGLTGACTTPNLACTSAGTCAQCAPGSTSACTGSTPLCDSTTFRCVGCTLATQATDCPSGASPYCNTTSGSCMAAAVALTSPPASGFATTTSTTPVVTGTGVAGQSVTVTAGGTTVCTATVAAGGTWSCTSTTLPLGAATIVASSVGLTSTGTLTIQCAANGQCGSGQVCSVGTGLCVTPACTGSAGSGSSADCPGLTPVCGSPGTSSAACGSCGNGTVYNTTSFLCVSPTVSLTAPPAAGTASTTNQRSPISGTGVPGQTVVVTASGAPACMAVVAAGSTWTCTPTADLPLGSLTIVGTSAGATSTGSLIVSCTLDGQCSTGQVCNVGTGACIAPVCRGNSGVGSTADCPIVTPVCANSSTAAALCTTCSSGQVFNTATSICVPPSVALTSPPAGGTASTTSVRPTFTGTGVPGQSVTVNAGGTAVCTTSVATSSAWSCVPLSDLAVGSLTISATSAGLSSVGTLVVQCTGNGQCAAGQACNTSSGACVTPTCLGNAGSSSGGSCPSATPVCLNPNTSDATCSTCPTAQVYNSATLVCVSPSVALTSPPAEMTTTTTNLLNPVAGTGVPGQSVAVVASGVTLCSTTVATGGTWSCAPSSNLVLGSLTVVATSGGASSSAVLAVHCTLDAQCTSGQVCNVMTGACVTPSCRGNAGSGSGGDCPIANPICMSPASSSAACAACATGQVYNAASFVCVAPAVALLAPMSGGTTSTTNLLFSIQGTGVAGQPVTVTANGVTICAAIVATAGAWTCTPMTVLPLGLLSISANSGGATSNAMLNVACTLDAQCLTGQVCNTALGSCVAPTCRGNAGTASGPDCPAGTPVCTAPSSALSACVACAGILVYDSTSFRCVAPSVTLTSPPANGSAITTQVRPAVTGLGIPGQSVTVTANGMSACTTSVSSTGGWSCLPMFDLGLGSETIVVTSAGATSLGTLIVNCTSDPQCTVGQVCNTSGGSCVTPSCRGNAGSGTAGDCPVESPVCSLPNTDAAACGICPAALVYDSAMFSCVAPAVSLISPPADSTTSTTNLQAPVSGTGVSGQTVSVTDNGVALCSATVAATGTWTCMTAPGPAGGLPLGSNTIVATSAGVTSSGVLVVKCTVDGQCGVGQVCGVSVGICVTPSCRGNSGSGSAADCTAAAPVCLGPGTAGASCEACPTSQVFNTVTFLCVSPVVTLASPPAGGFENRTNPIAPVNGTGVPGQSVSVTVNGQSLCTTSVAPGGGWTCAPSFRLSVGPLLVTATSAGATSTATLILHCTDNAQCTMGQVCDVDSGVCTTPSCRGNAGSGSTADCAPSTPVCGSPGTAAALCGPCATGQVYDTSGHQCVSPVVALTSPPSGGSANTKEALPSFAGSGIPGQSVTVAVNGMTICTVSVDTDGTWSCVPSSDLPLGTNVITVNSAGSVNSATLVVQCTEDPQCETGQVCNPSNGACTTPSCTANAGAGTTANCPSATPVCEKPGTAEASCSGCATAQVYDTAADLCVSGAVALTFPPANGTATTTAATPALLGTGVPGQSVTVTSGSQTLCLTIVLSEGTWTCSSTIVLPPGSNLITAQSAGATSTGTLVEQCTLNIQCSSGAPACNAMTGLCVGCTADVGCAGGSYCNATSTTCAPTQATGAICDRAAQCAGGVCVQGRCAPAVADAGAEAGVDAGVTDAAVSDAGVSPDGDSGSTTVPTSGDSGCNCSAGGSASGGALGGLAVILLGLAGRRSRRRSGRHSVG